MTKNLLTKWENIKQKNFLLAISGILIFVLVLALGFSWHITTTPSYTATKLSEAYKKKDMALFNDYADLDSISDNMVDESMVVLKKKYTKEMEDNPFATLGLSVIDQQKDELKRNFKEGVEKSVKGEEESSDSDSSNAIEWETVNKPGNMYSNYFNSDFEKISSNKYKMVWSKAKNKDLVLEAVFTKKDRKWIWSEIDTDWDKLFKDVSFKES